MNDKLTVLFELPGVQKVKEMWQNPQNHEYPASSYLRQEINDVSNALFCICEWDTYLDEDDPRDEDHYEERFQACELPFDEARAFWDTLGWDLRGPDGLELNVADAFKRQIVAASGHLVAGAEFHPNGDGFAAYNYEGQFVGGVEQFEERLQADAQRWLTKRTGKLPLK